MPQFLATGLTLTSADGTINLDDGTAYKIAAETRQSVGVTYQQIKATSPALAGEYLIHSVPQMVVETVKIWVYADDVTELNERYQALKTGFEHWSYQLAWTFGDYAETWNCNAVGQIQADMGQGLLHNYMAGVTLQVPRYPTVETP